MSRTAHNIFLLLSFLLVTVFMSLPVRVTAQESEEVYETSLFLNVPQAGSIEIPALILHQEVWLPVAQVFSFLRIKFSSSTSLDSIWGYINDPDHAFTIDYTSYTIRYQERSLIVDTSDIILTNTSLFMNTTLFASVFGLEFNFSFRSLSLSLDARVELPVIRLLRQEQMRKNLARLEGKKEVDTTIGKDFRFFHFGMADWSLLSTQEVNRASVYHGTLSLGSVLFGGEADIKLRFNSNQPFTEEQQYYLWHFVNNDNRFLRQVEAGKITPERTSSIYDPIVGIELTNTPTTFRRSFCSYTLSDYTEPGWIVELYVNHVLIEYTRADASGFFLFEVPLVYGNTSVTLRFYGPYGEERMKEKSIIIPISFLPPRKLEYSVSGGMVEDGKTSMFARGIIRYGLGKRITVGAGTEFLSTSPGNKHIPFINLALRVGSRLLLSGEYAAGVRFKGLLNYMHKSNLRVEVLYSLYHRNQQAINTSILEERKVTVSMPFQRKNLGLFFRFTYDQIILPTTGSINLEFLVSGTIFGISTNFTTFALFPNHFNPTIYSNLSLGIRFPKGFILTPQLQYEYTKSQFTTAKIELEKSLWRNGAVTLSYETAIVAHTHAIQFGFRYDLPFVQTGINARIGNTTTTITEFARGSMIIDYPTRYAGFGYRTSVGRGGITILSFLDLNYNTIWDPGEPRVNGLDIISAGNRIRQHKRDSTIRILDLEPYTYYYLEINPTSFDNIAWQIETPRMNVYVEPNRLTLVQVPISILGEVNGTVYLQGPLTRNGIGRVVVQFYSADSTLIGETMTEPDGYFSYMKLTPGSYYACLQPAQIEKLGFRVDPELVPFIITSSMNGDIVGGLEFYLYKKE